MATRRLRLASARLPELVMTTTGIVARLKMFECVENTGIELLAVMNDAELVDQHAAKARGDRAQMLKALHRYHARPVAPRRRKHGRSRQGVPELPEALRRILRPGFIGSAAANRPDRRQGIGAEFGEAAIAERLDAGDAFEHGLQEEPRLGGPRFEPRRECRIVDRKALARPRQGIIVEAGRRVGIDERRQPLDVVAGEMRHDGLAAGIGAAAGQPGIANAVAVDAVLGGKDRRCGEQLQCQCRAERGDAVARFGGAAGEEGGAAIGGAGDDRRHRPADRTWRRLRR